MFSKGDKSVISRTRVNLLYQARKLEEYIRIILSVRFGYTNLLVVAFWHHEVCRLDDGNL